MIDNRELREMIKDNILFCLDAISECTTCKDAITLAETVEKLSKAYINLLIAEKEDVSWQLKH